MTYAGVKSWYGLKPLCPQERQHLRDGDRKHYRKCRMSSFQIVLLASLFPICKVEGEQGQAAIWKTRSASLAAVCEWPSLASQEHMKVRRWAAPESQNRFGADRPNSRSELSQSCWHSWVSWSQFDTQTLRLTIFYLILAGRRESLLVRKPDSPC